MINVMLVDDPTLVTEGIKSLLALPGDIKAVAEASDGEQPLTICQKAIQHNTVDVILMDIRMPIKTGIEALKSLRDATIDISVIMLTTFDDHQLVLQAIQASAKSDLLKNVSLETLVDGIKIESIESKFFKGGKKITLGTGDNFFDNCSAYSSPFNSGISMSKKAMSGLSCSIASKA